MEDKKRVAIYIRVSTLLKKMKNDENVELAIKALRNQSVLDELLGQGLKIISSNGDISDFDNYFEK